MRNGNGEGLRQRRHFVDVALAPVFQPEDVFLRLQYQRQLARSLRRKIILVGKAAVHRGNHFQLFQHQAHRLLLRQCRIALAARIGIERQRLF